MIQVLANVAQFEEREHILSDIMCSLQIECVLLK
jgi:hypothetical protein